MWFDYCLRHTHRSVGGRKGKMMNLKDVISRHLLRGKANRSGIRDGREVQTSPKDKLTPTEMARRAQEHGHSILPKTIHDYLNGHAGLPTKPKLLALAAAIAEPQSVVSTAGLVQAGLAEDWVPEVVELALQILDRDVTPGELLAMMQDLLTQVQSGADVFVFPDPKAGEVTEEQLASVRAAVARRDAAPAASKLPTARRPR